jgi:hypothetical protein
MAKEREKLSREERVMEQLLLRIRQIDKLIARYKKAKAKGVKFPVSFRRTMGDECGKRIEA